MARRLCRPQRKSQKGQSIVEVAVAMPLLLILVIGIIEFGIVFATYLAVTNAAREGAIFASIYPKLADSSCGKTPHDDGDGNILCNGSDDNDSYDYAASGSTTVTVWEEYTTRV